jgi:serine/threonine protein kinase
MELFLVIHRDLAARNCLVARHEVNGEVYETVKISDFGLTRSMINDDNKDYYCLDINYIPIRWWPPESIEGSCFSINL